MKVLGDMVPLPDWKKLVYPPGTRYTPQVTRALFAGMSETEIVESDYMDEDGNRVVCWAVLCRTGGALATADLSHILPADVPTGQIRVIPRPSNDDLVRTLPWEEAASWMDGPDLTREQLAIARALWRDLAYSDSADAIAAAKRVQASLEQMSYCVCHEDELIG